MKANTRPNFEEIGYAESGYPWSIIRIIWADNKSRLSFATDDFRFNINIWDMPNEINYPFAYRLFYSLAYSTDLYKRKFILRIMNYLCLMSLMKTPQPSFFLTAHSNSINCLLRFIHKHMRQISDDILISSHKAGIIVKWNFANEEKLAVMEAFKEDARCLLNLTTDLFICGNFDNTIYLHDKTSLNLINKFNLHSAPVTHMTVCNNNHLQIASGTNEGEIFIWNYTTGEPLKAWITNQEHIESLKVMARKRNFYLAELSMVL